MKFRTEIPNFPKFNNITYQDKVFFIGSCFSNNISNVLAKRKFNILSNPFGISYNPISIFDELSISLDNKKINEEELFCHNEIWSSFSFHSDMSSFEKNDALQKINKNIQASSQFLKQTNFLFITFGTAWIYEKEGKIVSNCHKIPSKHFAKRLLSIEEIISKAKSVFKKILTLNNEMQIVLTVSPVRHLRDGLIENNQSKSTLLLAVQKICENIKQASYFPAYELLIDDLRDYRFYKEDLTHPNKQAIKYITQKFDESFFSSKTNEQIKKVEQINNSLAHKVNYKETESYKKFKTALLKKISILEDDSFDFSNEKQRL